jgi:2-keto-4-pentenoate hydratase/2-oxohepta-3-ene-1,7-dioic acid hydratase in catechol pathway
VKLASFRLNGADTYGVVKDGGLVDIGGAIGPTYPDLKTALAEDALIEIETVAEVADPAVSVDDAEFLPVIPNPGKVVCIGLNYKSHVEETGRSDSDYPVIFTRWADTQVGHNQPMIKPKNSERYDYEGELAVIMGKAARHVSEADALGHVAGYACYNDGSVRDWQRHTHQFTPGKNFPGTGGFGPWMVTTDEIPDPSDMELVTRVNGEEVQRSRTDLLIFDVPFLVHYISGFCTLEPGDVIVTGTPGGVGFKRNPPLFMFDGDTVEVEIDKIGTLVNPIADE